MGGAHGHFRRISRDLLLGGRHTGIGFDDDDDVYLAYNIYNVFIIYFISLNEKQYLAESKVQ